MRKTIIVITGFITVIVLSFAFKQPDKPRYENLKVLSKNTTKQEMDSIMKHFAASLGVKCTFCHVRNNEQNNFDFASDKIDHKLIARNMWKMTSKINKKYFKEHKDANRIAAVTCYTCHNGHEEPGTRPPAPTQRPPQQQPQPPAQPPASAQQQ